MAKKIILIHGRNFKPDKSFLKKSYLDAIHHGLERDFDKTTVTKFKKIKAELAYYGDLSNQFLSTNTDDNWTPSIEEKDKDERIDTLSALKLYKSNQFTKSKYKKVRENSDAFKETVADILSGPLSIFGIGDKLVGAFAPDMKEYWNPDTQFGSDVRWRLTEVLRKAISAGDDILLISHSLGTIVSYDVLWKLSHYGEYRALREKKPNISLITLGSPLGDENVKKNLKGSDAKGERAYPTNIKDWKNFAAEDDYISHDTTLQNDFKHLSKFGQKPKISDDKIYNMAIRGDDANPHHSTGYLIHPKVIKVIADWM